MILRTAVVSTFAALALVGCGAQMSNTPDAGGSGGGTATGGGGGATGGGGGSTGGGGGATGGGGGSMDAGVDAGMACTVSTTAFGDAGTLVSETYFYPADSTDPNDYIVTYANLEPGMPADGLVVEFYGGYGVFAGTGPVDAGLVDAGMDDAGMDDGGMDDGGMDDGGIDDGGIDDGGIDDGGTDGGTDGGLVPVPVVAIAPGTYTLAGDELQYSTCGICVRLQTNLTSAGYDDDYMVTGGTVTITRNDNVVGGTFSFTLSNLTFRHATILENPPYSSSLVNDSCESAVESASSTGLLTTPP